MKTRITRFVGLCLLLLQTLTSSAIVLTNDTEIGLLDTNYEGGDILVSNCTLTVSGSHSFSSVHLLSGGKLVPSFSPNCVLQDRLKILGEEHLLTSTNAELLTPSNIIAASIVLRDSLSLVTYVQGVDYVVGEGDPFLSVRRTANSSIPDPGLVQVDFEVLISSATGLYLDVTGDLVVETGAAIDAAAKGYTNGLGQGAGKTVSSSGSGAGHGGYGGVGAGNTPGGIAYGSVTTPFDNGSGGGDGRGAGPAGGGVIRLYVRGTLQVDGLITADGGDAKTERSGGASGGSIWLMAQTLAGSGSISADGGAGEPSLGGGGGGGRIAIYYDTNAFSGTITARGGSGFLIGGAGTIYTAPHDQSSRSLLIHNGGQLGTNTPFFLSVPADVTVQAGAKATPVQPQSIGNLLVGSNAYVLVSTQTLNVLNATIQRGGVVSADGSGYSAGSGPGAGKSFQTNSYYSGTGAGFGGCGAPSQNGGTGGSCYGSVSQPYDSGSGGGNGGVSSSSGGGSGGGVLHLIVSRQLIVDGVLSGNGMPASGQDSGGGSGGSLWIDTGTLSGSGTISANGGAASGIGGAGGGGRIALYFQTNTFTGSLSARGAGNGGTFAGAGTIYLQSTGGTPILLIDNNATSAAPTFLPSGISSLCDLTIRGGAVVVPNSSQTLHTLSIGSNSWLRTVFPSQLSAFDVTIAATAGITADGNGNLGGKGPGAGKYQVYNGVYSSSGAGYGGVGGDHSAGGVTGGNSYGNITQPTDQGSGGGTGGGSSYGNGGAGGGCIDLFVSNGLQLEGRISADGLAGSGVGSGGGSGGSVYLRVGHLSGHGIISANGGLGNGSGGGGGGGRIALYTQNAQYRLTNTFAGMITAWGAGVGRQCGGPGSIYIKEINSNGLVLLDNNGNTGPATDVFSASFPASANLTLNPGVSVCSRSAPAALGNLLVASNAWMFVTNRTLTLSNATVQAGGGINANGTGYTESRGPGAGSTIANVGSGAGHGGYGVGTSTGAAAGAPYDSSGNPIDMGSGGGAGASNKGGPGGGLITLNLSGTLRLDGVITADGFPGLGPDAGAGSGGGVRVIVHTMIGSGLISANGGNGNNLGGAGGGGRIAITYYSNAFTGKIQAYGGIGPAGVGGAGTISLSQNQSYQPKFIIDNNGQYGGKTDVNFGGSGDVIITSGAIAQAGPQNASVHDLTLSSNAWLLLTNVSSDYPFRISGNGIVEAGCGIIADGLGYFESPTPGPGQSGLTAGGGGGHGGAGSASTTGVAGGPTYDFVDQPRYPGSGGGKCTSYSYTAGGRGGGLLYLVTTGILRVDGRISADGASGVGTSSGGGSGGTVRLEAGTLSGKGMISACGAQGNDIGGSGGGGRISLRYRTNLFSGVTKAWGAGSGTNYGGAGTIYRGILETSYGSVTVDNGGRLGSVTDITGTISNLTLTGGAVANLKSTLYVTDLLITSNAWIKYSNSNQLLNVSRDATIQAGGGITANEAGYSGGQGPGAGSSGMSSGGGGGYGGFGASANGALGGNSYGTVFQPTSLGSGGNGNSAGSGKGGGAVRMIVSGNLLLNGQILAEGGQGARGAGGGSGGSIWLTLGNWSGSGTISANGGDSDNNGGGGGGGRIFITCASNLFAGQVSAYGGEGYSRGGAGTILTKLNNETVYKLEIDNGNYFGTNTPIVFDRNYSLTVRDGAIAIRSGAFSPLQSLRIENGGVLKAVQGQTNLDLTILGDAEIQPGGTITVDGRGFPINSGPGAGQSRNEIGSGAGYGGNGGASSELPGGITYGSASQPVDLGSGGGRGWGQLSRGSEGGGAIRLNVLGKLTVDGQLSANGNPGFDDDAGGGSGGSIWARANELAGTGWIAAEGGAGELFLGGGGGGGRIALYAPSNSFNGAISVAGGEGFVVGKNGSVVVGTNSEPFTVVAQTPSGTTNAYVSNIDLWVNGALSAGTVLASNLAVTTPNGTLYSTQLTTVAIDSSHLRILMPEQTTSGLYQVRISDLQSMFGEVMASEYIGSFTIALPEITGRITDPDGLPVSGVLLRFNDVPLGFSDSNGNYRVAVPSDWVGAVAPLKSKLIFAPANRSYTNLLTSVSDQNFTAASTIAPTVTPLFQGGTNLVLRWSALPGVTYQVQYSTNLVTWYPVGADLPGTNDSVELPLADSREGLKFFRVRARN